MKIQPICNQSSISHKAYLRPDKAGHFAKLWKNAEKSQEFLSIIKKFNYCKQGHEIEIMGINEFTKMIGTVEYLLYNHNTDKTCSEFLSDDEFMKKDSELKVLLERLLERAKLKDAFFKENDATEMFCRLTGKNF